MKHRLLALALMTAGIGLGFTGAASPAYGCSCVMMTIDEAIRPDTPAAFIGTAVAVADNPDSGLGGEGEQFVLPRVWTFEVETVLVGELPDLVEVGSGLGDADCGYDFASAGRVGVVTYGEPGNLSTGICGGVWDADELFAAYGPGTDPIAAADPPIAQPVDDGPPVWFGPALATGLLASIGVTLAATRRRRTSQQDGWNPSSPGT